MIDVRYSEERGRACHGWLDSRHSFSFADYYDPHFMGFRDLRVINQDRVAPGTGFPQHPHRDMEIISLVLEGELQHRDSMANQGVIRPGEIQLMSAGTGIMHSEWNPSPITAVHFLQIWILPQDVGMKPTYQQRSPQRDEEGCPWILLSSPDGRNGSLEIRQDVDLWRSRLAAGGVSSFGISGERGVWIQLLAGDLQLEGKSLSEGDGAAVRAVVDLEMKTGTGADFLLFDLA